MVRKEWHPCLVPDLSGKALSVCPLSMMLAVGLSYMDFIMLRNAPSTPTFLSVFIISGWLAFLFYSGETGTQRG